MGIKHFLDQNGNNYSGSYPMFTPLSYSNIQNFALDYSVTPQTAELTVPTYFCFDIHAVQFIISWDEVAAPTVDWEKFGNLVALGNGIQFKAVMAGYSYAIPYNFPITQNGQLFNPVITVNNLAATIIATIPFIVPLTLQPGDNLTALLQDNFSTLNTLRINVLGNRGTYNNA